MKARRTLLCAALALALLMGSSVSIGNAAEFISYSAYEASHPQAQPAGEDLWLAAQDAVDTENTVMNAAPLEGVTGTLSFVGEKSRADWQVDIPEEGLYAISLSYLALPGRSRDIEFSLAIDGEQPFAEMGRFTLSRAWQDAGPITQDNRGNDVRPQKVEVSLWQTTALRDADGMQEGNFAFYFTAGTHTLSIAALGEPFALAGIRLYGEAPLPSYEEALAEAVAAHPDALSAAVPEIRISAELSHRTSSPVLSPIADRSSPATETRGQANDLSKNRLNAMGGANWKFSGQWISWTFEVAEAGFYRLTFKARQNFSRGMPSTRQVRIDDQTPFEELSCIAFPYKADWQMITPGRTTEQGFAPYLVYLTEGAHEIALEVVPGPAAPSLRTAQETVLSLSHLYRKIIMITGTSPDPYQDYYLEKKVPGLLETFADISGQLKAQVQALEDLTGVRGSEASLLEEVALQLDSMTQKPDTIPARLERLKDNIGSLGAWILQRKEQPLELDYILFTAEDASLPAADAGFLQSTAFGVGAVALSFFEDYNAVGNVYEDREALTVWISQQDLATTGSSSGRDQALIIKQLIDDSFTVQTGIPVNLTLVDSAQTLVQAVMGGKSPDVALTLPESTPVNLAMRGGLYDLSTLPAYAQVADRFYPSALVAYEYEGGVYALPETQTFNMLFYRTDIFEELGLAPPDTWADFYRVMKVLQKTNLQVGVPEQQNIFEMFLFQQGGKFYTDDLRATGFDQPEALAAFTEWTGLYKNQGLPISFDFYNRFRTGEMPMGITSYAFYNTLAVAAPELRGLWRMVPVPGTAGEDGSISRQESCYGTAAVMLKSAKDPDAAWEFLTWWTSAEVQARYGLELEYLIGPAARYNTANKEAFESLPWNADERGNLTRQWEAVWDVPQLPGNYNTDRNIQFAFRRVVYYYENERETLFEYNKEINKEITRKRQEFGLE